MVRKIINTSWEVVGTGRSHRENTKFINDNFLELYNSGGGGGGSTVIEPTFESTGEWTRGVSITLVPESKLLIFPGNYIAEANSGPWVNKIYVDGQGLLTSFGGDVVGVTDNINFTYCDSIEQISLPNLEIVGNDFFIYNNPLLVNLILTSLRYVNGELELGNCSVEDIDLSALEVVEDLYLYHNDPVTSINLENLTTVLDDFNVYDHENLTNINLDSLEFVGGELAFNTNEILQSISLPNLTRVHNLYVSSNIDLEDVNVPILDEIYGTVGFYNLNSLQDFYFSNNLKLVGSNVYFEDCPNLTENTVDNILTSLASLDGTNGTTSYDNKTINIDGDPPSSVGLSAINILENRGNTVNVTPQ